MKTVSSIGVQIPKILLPKSGADLHKWAVIACDQFTSEPEYWHEVSALVGDAPSTYHLILPEIYLDTPEEGRRVQSIQQTMQTYLARDLLVEHEGLILVERTATGKMRHGLMLALDLEKYNYSKGSASLIRATEDTILERIPPRTRIRSGAALELPHILVLIDDPEHTVIEPLVAARSNLKTLYDFELMLDSGRLTGYSVNDENLEAQALAAMDRLAAPGTFAVKYGLGKEVPPPLLFAVGDGNHSLATAKAVWEQIKPQVGMEHPAQYALVEIENIHDAGLAFEPIHRVLFGVRGDFVAALRDFFPNCCQMVPCTNAWKMAALVDSATRPEHTFGVVTPEGCAAVYVTNPPSNLAVGTLQSFLDAWEKSGGFTKIDYVHGKDAIVRLGGQKGNLGFYLPAISKSTFFKTVIVDGTLPRKAFSMGEAKEKRFYMETRRIT